MPSKLLSITQPTNIQPASVLWGGRATSDLNILRNSFNTSTWLLIGAVAQSILVLLPIRKFYAILPVFFFLALRIGDLALISFGLRRNEHMDGVIHGKTAALRPGPNGEAGKPGEGKICLAVLTARSNHPLGNFAADFKKIGAFFTANNADLNANAATNGFLGATSWLGMADRTNTSEMMNLYYFRSRAALDEWAHGSVHREGWDFWNRLVKEGKDAQYSLAHEVYDVPAGNWEGVYLNFAPTGLGSASYPFKGKAGEQLWASPLVDARRGRLRSSKGRSGIDDGAGNEKYGDEFYAEA